MNVLETLASRAIELDLDTLEIEYKDGYEEVSGLKGTVGFGIARFRGTSPEAKVLREELQETAKARRRVTVSGSRVELRVRVFDSFGEAAFRVELRRTGRLAAANRRRTGSKGGSQD